MEKYEGLICDGGTLLVLFLVGWRLVLGLKCKYLVRNQKAVFLFCLWFRLTCLGGKRTKEVLSCVA